MQGFVNKCLVLLVFCVFPWLANAGKEIENYQLFEVWENAYFDRFVYNVQVDFSKYNKVLFFPMTFDRLKITESEGKNKKLVKNWHSLSWDEMDKICGFFDLFAKKKFKNKRVFALSDRGGEDTLAIEFRMSSFRPAVDKNGTSSLNTVGSSSTNSLGVLMFTAVVADSKTGELIAVIEDGIEIGNPSGLFENNKTQQNRSWRASFKKVINKFYLSLVKLQEEQLALGN